MRLVTWANNKVTDDVCIESEDVISFNSYPAWYDRPGNVSYAATFWAEKVAWAAANWPSKPLTISETGAGGVYSWTNDTAPAPGVFWSQKYQAAVVMADAGFLVGSPSVSGLSLWQLTDIKANDNDSRKCGSCIYAPHPPSLTQPWNCTFVDVNCGRPGGENNKGTVDAWRRPKEVASQIAALFGSARETDLRVRGA